MLLSIKKKNHILVVSIIAVALALAILFFAPGKKEYSILFAGLAGVHVIIALIAITAGWIVIYSTHFRKTENIMKSKRTVKADYGQDMLGIVISSAIIGVITAILAHLVQSIFLTMALAIVALLAFTISITGIWNSRYGKLKLRDKVLKILTLKGSESILDIGCGKGLLLIEAAKRIPDGIATGADIWDKTLEYSYTSQMAINNAKIEGVEDRVRITTADVQSMPFENNSFDVVMTSLMMHHVPDTTKAVNEIVRVTKPGGTVLIADVNSKRFIQMFKEAGLVNVQLQYATRLFFMPAYVVTGIKTL